MPASSGGSQEGDQDRWTKPVARNDLVAKYEYETTEYADEEWRRMPEIPTAEELSQEDVEVPCNIIDDSYESVEEYLSTHYELLREDAVAGLRDCIAQIRMDPDMDETPHMAVYENVMVTGITYTQQFGVCTKISFSLNRVGKQIRWSQSKRLIPGSIVCLSDDRFQTFRVATVVARPLDQVEQNPHEIDILFKPGEIEIDSSKPMLMVECKSSYFEAYKWVLKALQRMRPDNFPLHRYLCFMDKDIGAPGYVEQTGMYNLSTIFPDSINKEKFAEVPILEEWPDLKDPDAKTSMDATQMEALKAILTKEIAVVQGPPGTGKTYTSVQALTTILNNMTDDEPPIIVACQTNHALDQILNYIYVFESNIIRLGGRTKDKENILRRTLHNIRNSAGQINIPGSNRRAILRQLDAVKDKMRRLTRPLREDLISPEGLFELGVIEKKQAESFVKGASGWVQASRVYSEKPDSPISMWLGESIDKVEIMEDLQMGDEEADIEYEELKDIEAEFLGGNPGQDDDQKLYGTADDMKNKYRVADPVGTPPEDIHKAAQKRDVFQIPQYLRAALYCHWRREAMKKIDSQFKELNLTYQRLCQELKITRMEKDSFLLSRAKLIGMTTTGLSKYRSLVASTKPKILLIEEAAEVLEAPVVVGCLPSIQQLILVGDHKQLRGKCSVHALDDDPYNLNISLFERWVLNNMPYITLQTQRRMRPEIREILNPIYKETPLQDHESVMGRDPIMGMGNTNIFWFCHSNSEGSFEDSPSKVNVFEAEMITKFVEYLVLNQQDPAKITILTFYTGQRQILARLLARNVNLQYTKIQIATVDSFQGEENDIVILSLVRSNLNNTIGFLSNENRVCVALSRAQRGFYIFGNAEMVTRKSNLWWDIGKLLQRSAAQKKIGFQLPVTCHNHKTQTLIEDVIDWNDLSGGCRQKCGAWLPCKHKCPLTCHPFDHSDFRCQEECERDKMRCGHRCKTRCWEECFCEVCGMSRSEQERDQNGYFDSDDMDDNQWTPAPKKGYAQAATTVKAVNGIKNVVNEKRNRKGVMV
ncbi:P-loop containing nucleoside triphosphate hydrolase protein [Ascodesmis nigricans]|uniref:P-loop containing nucleoside triphosphate hydrolase protein n=1 Tax=Ascodesmis nigricans TaxID=341454 RepID=A0A4S2MMF4_9PEZI|nr:P-loop containing nucleoside triphosphate hydrolase protein [Ascodesmis nigricans]